MKYRLLSVLASAALLLTACSGSSASSAAASQAQSDVNSGFVAASSTVTASTPRTKDAAESETLEDLSNMELDPPYSFDVDTMVPGDFGDYFTTQYPVEVSEYTLLASDSTYSNTVTVIKGQQEGPSVYVVAGVHGNEEAAWQAGKLLKKAGIQAGTLYVLAPANRWGASKVPKSRYLDGVDLNRSFPGSASGTPAQRVANAIYQDIAEKQPDFVLDLHEASVLEEGRDFLGSSIIFTDVTLFDDLYYSLLWDTQDGKVTSHPFNNYSPGPAGSINNTVTTNLRIPVMTVETFRGYQMDNRIGDQLAVVQYVLQYYEMI